MPPNADPNEHTFTEFLFLGKRWPLAGPLTINGGWSVKDNWDYSKMHVAHPQFPKLATRLSDFIKTFFRGRAAPDFVGK